MAAPARKVVSRQITVRAAEVDLTADICLPENATGLVLFAHGSGSTRLSPRNQQVAEFLNRGSIATILTDLLTAEENAADRFSGDFRFDIQLLVRRMEAVTDWACDQKDLKHLQLGYFGASTGAAAALGAAAARPAVVRAVVSRGGRPDLARDALEQVRAASLFIVGGDDSFALSLNREAMSRLPLSTPQHLEIIPGASHLLRSLEHSIAWLN